MDISTFFKNGDPSYPTLGFDGGFKAIPINRFSDETYFEASGNVLIPPSNLNARSKEAYSGVFSSWRPSYANDCKKLSDLMTLAQERLNNTNDKVSKGDKVAADYINGYNAAIDKLKELSALAKCDIPLVGGVNPEDINKPTEVSTGGWIAIIGSTVIVLGVVGYFLYRKYKK
jgi:hypothetical protein